MLLGRSRAALTLPAVSVLAHRHATGAVVVGVDGDLDVLADGARRRGDVLFIAPGFLHGLDLHGGRLAVFLLPPGCDVAGAHVSELRNANAWRELGRATAGGELSSFDAYERALAGSAIRRARMDRRLRRALGALEDQLAQNTSVVEVARAVDLSPSRLMGLAREELRVPLREYRRWRRALHVVRLYAAGASLTGAAHEAGYASSAHLSAASRRQFGIKPSDMLHARARSALRLVDG